MPNNLTKVVWEVSAVRNVMVNYGSLDIGEQPNASNGSMVWQHH